MKRTLSIIFASCLFFLGTGHIFGAPPCGFSGYFMGKKTRSLKCEIARAGSSPYLLAQVLYKGRVYLIDLNPLPQDLTSRKFNLTVIAHPKPRKQVFYKGKFSTRTIKGRKNPHIVGVRDAYVVKNRKGQRIKLRGTFFWNTKKLGGGNIYGGRLSFKLGSRKIGPVKTRLKPWNSGYQIHSTISLARGETISLVIQIPSLKKSRFKSGDKNVAMRATYFKIGKDKKMSMKMYTKHNIRIGIKKSGEKIRLKFGGKIISKKGKESISGVFEGSR